MYRIFGLQGFKYFIHLIDHLVCEGTAHKNGGFLPYGYCDSIARARIYCCILAVSG